MIQAHSIKNTEIANHLALPPVKIHCSVLAEDAIKAAIADYKDKIKMITVTSSAIHHIKELISSRNKSTLGVKVGISTKGCSGLSYTMEFVEKVDDNDEILTFDDVKIFIDRKASLFLIGTKNGLR